MRLIVICAAMSAGLLAPNICAAQQTTFQQQTPQLPFYPNQLQSGATPYTSVPATSGIVVLGNSGLTSGVTSINTNPLAEGTPVRGQAFSQGGLSTVPGGDTFTQSTNSSNVTNSTSGLGYSNNRR